MLCRMADTSSAAASASRAKPSASSAAFSAAKAPPKASPVKEEWKSVGKHWVLISCRLLSLTFKDLVIGAIENGVVNG